MIEALTHPVSDADLTGLARLLVDAVESGAAVTFLPPLSVERARDWWRGVVDGAPPGSVFLVAREGDHLLGTVHYQPATAPNQPHRADVSKLIVHRDARRRGLGNQLMAALEQHARRQGLRLLTLDTKRGDPAERLYARLGWTSAGVIPDFALNPDGTYHDTVIFYKTLA
ncbi:MAG: GNAT family N-acetyltransferase [Gemmatimonadales bacterium]